MGKQDWRRGMRRLDPGVYVTGDGTLHFDAHEFLVGKGIPPTRENLALIEKQFESMFKEEFGATLPVHHVDDDQ